MSELKIKFKKVFKVLDKDGKAVELVIRPKIEGLSGSERKANEFSTKDQVVKALKGHKAGTYKIVTEEYIEVVKPK